MARLPLAFFSVGALCVMAGMVWGSVMGASQNFAMAPAHAHLNLLGWASLALMGTFYALSGRGGRLGWVNFGFSTVGLAVMVPSLVMVLGGDTAAEKGIMVGATLAMIGMAVFLFVVLSSWRSAKAA